MFSISLTEKINGLDKKVPAIEYEISGLLFFEDIAEARKQIKNIEKLLQDSIVPQTKYKYICEKGIHIME